MPTSQDSSPGDPPPRHDAYAAFREPAFRRFALGMLVVQIGGAAQGIAIAWEVYVRTGSAMALGIVGLVQALPMLILTLPAGYLADCMDRRRLITLGMIGTTLTSIGLAVFSHQQGSIVAMYALLLLDASCMRLTVPARMALMPQLVPIHRLENALKWRSSLGQISSVVGPVVGGFIMAWSLPATYLFSAATTASFLLVLASLSIREGTRAPRGRMIGQVVEGLAFVWRRKILLGTISLDLFAVLLGGAVYLLPIFASDIIDLSGTGLTEEQALGWLWAAPAVGAMVMALYLAHAPPIRRAGPTMLWSVAGFGAATLIFGLSTNLWLSLAMLAISGALDNVSVVVRHTLVQLLTPNEMRGRVSAVNSIFIGSSNEIGGFRAGAVASWIGPVGSVVVGGLATLGVVASWAAMFPNLRRFGRLTDPHHEERAAGRPGADDDEP
ncbi:MAG: MFS transporter [Phycisphaeraceae bacterium]|nr:MFS transporter [Phycisphaeraceae bacterium]